MDPLPEHSHQPVGQQSNQNASSSNWPPQGAPERRVRPYPDPRTLPNRPLRSGAPVAGLESVHLLKGVQRASLSPRMHCRQDTLLSDVEVDEPSTRYVARDDPH